MGITYPRRHQGGCLLSDEIRTRLAATRERRGMSLQDLSRTLGVTTDHLRRIERGQFPTKFEFVDSWAKALGFKLEIALVEA